MSATNNFRLRRSTKSSVTRAQHARRVTSGSGTGIALSVLAREVPIPPRIGRRRSSGRPTAVKGP